MSDVPLDVSCPYCGETQSIEVDPVDAATGRQVHDCNVCCRPIHVVVRRSGSSVAIEVATEDRD